MNIIYQIYLISKNKKFLLFETMIKLKAENFVKQFNELNNMTSDRCSIKKKYINEDIADNIINKYQKKYLITIKIKDNIQKMESVETRFINEDITEYIKTENYEIFKLTSDNIPQNLQDLSDKLNIIKNICE